MVYMHNLILNVVLNLINVDINIYPVSISVFLFSNINQKH